ncbi:MAG: ABC transporter substrate-binding protein [Thaumarchaeota archaeon]|nr:ABC transporter substrate-binding protein [Nitrososphaerota archaeon]
MVAIFNELLGEFVQLPETPTRMISFSPAITETLFMLGLGEHIVGVSAFCARPPEARLKKRVGSYNTAREDLLRDLRPDVIFTVTGYQRDFAFKLSKSFPVYPFELPVSVSGIIDFVVKLGLVVNAAEEARDLSAKLIRSLPKAQHSSRRPSTYVEIDLGGPVSFGAYSYITDALHLLGAESIFANVRSEWLTPNFEEVKGADPDIFFYEGKMFSNFDKADFESLIAERGWKNLNCVKNSHCFITPGPLDFLAHHGPSFIQSTLPWLEEKLSLTQ